jgi:ribonuclease J
MEVRIIKGTKQIGGCITEVSVKNSKIIIDFGDDLIDNNKEFELDGLTKGDSIYAGVFITHSHSDHIGLINKINKNIPVYVEKESLNIHNLTCDFCNNERVNRSVNTFEIPYINKADTKEKHVIFDNGEIKVSAYSTDHSSYNSCMFLIEGDGKKLLHTGDFRTHGRRSEYFKLALRKIGNVDMLITEGTTLTRYTKDTSSYMSEQELEEESYSIMDKYNQVLVFQSSTNVDRTVSFLRSALKNNKKFIVDLFSYYINETSTHFFDVDYKNIFVWISKNYKKKKTEWFKDKYMDIETSSKFGKNFVMEVKASMIDDIKLLHSKNMLDNACIIYSMWDGYIEQQDSLRDFLEELKKMNIKIEKLHTSGHADVHAMRLVNELLNPKQTIIIHTEDNSNGKDIFNNVITADDNEIIVVN